MKWAVIVILIVVSIVSTFLKARKNKQQREEQARREEERKRQYYGTTAEPRVRTLPVTEKVPTKSETNTGSEFKPIVDPFENVAVPEEGSLSPAQYYEWLCDYRAAEKAGVHRPIKTGKLSPFAGRLSKTDELAYLYKLSGFAPQNSLVRYPVEEKTKPINPTCLLRNDMHGSYPLDAKFSVHVQKPTRSAVSYAIPSKDPSAHDTFTSFYKDKN